ncbi:hypothetical protein ACROYT_G014489 [Oculina patagonica]
MLGYTHVKRSAEDCLKCSSKDTECKSFVAKGKYQRDKKVCLHLHALFRSGAYACHNGEVEDEEEKKDKAMVEPTQPTQRSDGKAYLIIASGVPFSQVDVRVKICPNGNCQAMHQVSFYDIALVSLDIMLEWRQHFKLGHPISNVISAKLSFLNYKLGQCDRLSEGTLSYIARHLKIAFYCFKAITVRFLDDVVLKEMLLQSSVQTSQKRKKALSVDQASCCVSSGSLHEEMLEQDSEASDGQIISPTAASTSPEVSTTDDTTVCSTPCTTPSNTSITADGPLATPLTTVSTKNRRCKGCTQRATQLDSSQRQTSRLKKNISELKKTIRELESFLKELTNAACDKTVDQPTIQTIQDQVLVAQGPVITYRSFKHGKRSNKHIAEAEYTTAMQFLTEDGFG